MKTEILKSRVTQAELKSYKLAAKRAQRTLSDWLRLVLNKEVTDGKRQ
jgi:hypothetical protein